MLAKEKSNLGLLILSLAAVASSFGACNYNSARDRQPPAITDSINDEKEAEQIAQKKESIDYALIKKLVFDTKCISCHHEGKAKGDVRLDNYQDVLKNIKEIEKDLLDNSMPPKKPLASSLKEIVLSWIKNGAPEKISPQSGSNTTHPPVTATNKNEMITRGEYLFNASSCGLCHSPDKAKPLAGGKELSTAFGVFYSTNISKDKKTGIGTWSEKDFIQALRHGIAPDGEYFYPVFPYTNYSKLTDSDILAIRAYIYSLPAVEQKNIPHKLVFPFNKRSLLYVWRAFNFIRVSKPNPENFLLAKGPFVSISERDIEWNRGAYLVEGALHCTVCHTPRNSLGSLLTNKWMSGSIESGETFPAPNITPDYDTGLRNWDANDWMRFLNLGETPQGHRVTGEMRKIIRYGTSQLTETDKKAVAKYLMSIKPVANKDLLDLIQSHPVENEPSNEAETNQ